MKTGEVWGVEGSVVVGDIGRVGEGGDVGVGRDAVMDLPESTLLTRALPGVLKKCGCGNSVSHGYDITPKHNPQLIQKKHC